MSDVRAQLLRQGRKESNKTGVKDDYQVLQPKIKRMEACHALTASLKCRTVERISQSKDEE